MTAQQTMVTAPFQLQACDEGASSLLIHHRGSCYLFDCWLEPSYYALHQRFYTGTRLNPVWIEIDDLPPLNGLFLSSVQNDHSDFVSLQKISLKNPQLKIWTSSSIATKICKYGRFAIEETQPGKAIFIGDQLKIIQLKGYGGCSPYLFQDIQSKQCLCIAPHGIHQRWLFANMTKLKQQLEISQTERLIATLCIGITPTVLNPLGGLYWFMPDRGINIPMPQQTLQLINWLQPKTILTIHQTPESRTGWATRHLVQFPWMGQGMKKDIGTLAAHQWLAQQYKKGVLVIPEQEPLTC